MKECPHAMRQTLEFSAAAIALAILWAAPSPAHSQKIRPTQEPVLRDPQDVSLDEYRKHLLTLQALTRACAQARDLKTCDPMLVGPDDRVPLDNSVHQEWRIVRYGWLRVLFSQAEEPDSAPEIPTRKKGIPDSNGADQALVQTTSQRLQNAQLRLAHDLAQSEVALVTAPDYNAQHKVLQQVLAGREFRNLKQTAPTDSALEKFGNWVNHLFEGLAQLRSHSVWVGRTITWGFLVLVGGLLAWLLVRWERRWRRRAVPEEQSENTSPRSPASWQLWLDQARKAAARAMWRDAIHLVYWAAITRLEENHVWPLDKSRTPREYIRSLAHDDTRRSELVALTDAFERAWYGGRVADECAYQEAEQLASSILAGGRPAQPIAQAEGGGR